MRLLLNAPAFGYGPVSKLYSVAKKLVSHQVECLFCGDGVAYEFMAREGVCETLRLNVNREEDCRKLATLAKNVDYALTVMEPPFVKYCLPEVKTGYIDSLLWMWDTQHFEQQPYLSEVSHYFIQHTFNAEELIGRFGIQHPVLVGGVIDTPAISERTFSRLVINFGGVENFFMSPDEIVYPFQMMRILAGFTPLLSHFEEVIVATSVNVAERLRREHARMGIRFTSLSHDEFVATINGAELLLTSPGLTTLIEAFALKTPTLFLPPQNYSQYLILTKLAEQGYPRPLLNWPFFYEDFEISPEAPEETAVRYVAETIQNFFADEAKKERLKSVIKEAIADPDFTRAISDFQARLIDRLGTNGADEILEVILKQRP